MRIYLTSNNKEPLEFVRMVLSRDYNYHNDIIFHYNDYGKPYLTNNDYYFNISHSGDMLAIAISNAEVGVDIELVKPRHHMDAIVGRCFIKKEKEEYDNSKDKLSYFYKHWTKMEAYTKMIGTGIKGYFNNLPDDYNLYIETRTYKENNNVYYLSIACLDKDEKENIEVIYE